MKEFEQFFESFDADGNGRLDQNEIETFLFEETWLFIKDAPSSAWTVGHCIVLLLEDVAYTKVLSLIASSIESKILAFSKTSVALPDNALASPDGNFLGLTKDNSDNPIVFIALATEPIFPGWEVSTKTMFIKLLLKRGIRGINIDVG